MSYIIWAYYSIYNLTETLATTKTIHLVYFHKETSYWTSYLWKLSPKILQIGLKNTSRWIKILIVNCSIDHSKC